MVDITKDEFWESRYEEIQTKNYQAGKIKRLINNNKLLTIGVIILSICIVTNIVLIYSFFKILMMM